MSHARPCARGLIAAAVLLAIPLAALGQAVKWEVPEDAGDPVITYQGLVPGQDSAERVREVLGEPVFESRWYNWKMYYPAEGREGMYDIVHLRGASQDSDLANIDRASIPEGFENVEAIRDRLGEPEYELRMNTWRMLDYNEQGLRFVLNTDDETIGVAQFGHGYRRVPSGERRFMDLSHLRTIPQPEPVKPAGLDGLQVGVAERIITPQDEDWLYHPFEVLEELKARIAVFSTDDLTVAIVGADTFGLRKPVNDAIREAVREFGVDHAIIGSSHTHSSGDTLGAYGPAPKPFHDFIIEQITDGVEEAVSNLQPVAELRSAAKELPMDGARVIDLIRNARNPGLMDPTVSVVQAIGEDGEAITTIVHFACHPESIETGQRTITPDFPGRMCDLLEEKGHGQPVFLNGALGGMISGDNRERTLESIHETAERFAEVVDELLEHTVQAGAFDFYARQRDFEVPVTNQDWIPRIDPDHPAPLEGEVRRQRLLTDMLYIRLGEAQFITLPGELFPEISFEILEQMDGYPRMLVGLGNDMMAYLIPPYDWRYDEYEESASPGAAAGHIVRDAGLRLLNDTP